MTASHRPRGPRSLTARLVATAVALVALVSLVVTGATALALDRYLTGQLDDAVAASLGRAIGPGPGDRGLPPVPSGERGEGRADARGNGPDLRGNLLGQGGGTLLAVLPGSGPSTAVARGLVVPAAGGSVVPLQTRTLRQLDTLPRDGRARTVRVALTEGGDGRDGSGGEDYRVVAATADDGSLLVVGLPTAGLDDTVRTIVVAGLVLTLLGVLVAAGSGAVLVRRQLRPLRRVAATAEEVARLPLASGEIELRTRVPSALADDRTEVGQVGAALNTLLGHVEDSLHERHRSEQRVRQFVADASHELRTPLTTIAGYAQLGRRTPDDAPSLALALDRVEEQSHRMAGLVEDLLLLARLDSGRPLETLEVDLTKLLLEAVADARVVAPEHRWQLDLVPEAVVARGDERRLHQVVTNLLTNAVRHTPAGTTVTVGARAAGSRVAMTVHDDGPGLPPTLGEAAFERFTRGDSSRSRGPGDAGGAGLGLSLVRAIALAHGGTVTVASRPGDTRFVVDLPASQA